VASKIETELEREEKEVPAYVLWEDVAALGWIPVREPIEEHASVSIDGAMVLIRDEGYREVKIVSVSEVVVEPEEEEVLALDKAAAEDQEEKDSDAQEETRGRQDGLKLTGHSYRAILGDKATFTPALKGELARR
jgi:DNA-binding protein YbaB